MSRRFLLTAVSTAALLSVSNGTVAQNITGGGSSANQYDYYAEFSTFNAAEASGAAVFNNGSTAQTADESLYWASGSGLGQSAFIYDDLTCDADKVLNGTTKCPTGGGDTYGSAETIYGASDGNLSSSLIGFWGTSSVGQAQAGNLIQLPSVGVGIAIAVRNSSVTTNSNVTLTDSDLCGIFSGLITDWRGTSAATKLAAGAIKVVYRSDSSGNTYLLWNHLKAVCTAANSAFNLTLLGAGPGNTFTSLFAGGTVPTTPGGFTGASAVTGVAATLLASTSAIGYVTPDFTDVDAGSDALVANPADAGLIAAYLVNAASRRAYLPTVANLVLGLGHISTSVTYTGGGYPEPGDSPIDANAVPPASTAPWNPANWVPLTGDVTAGYPILGYGSLDFAQCYTNKAVAAGVVAFLNDHYGQNSGNAATYAAILNRNGLVQIAASGAKAYVGAIKTQVLTAKNAHAIGNATACKGLAGR